VDGLDDMLDWQKRLLGLVGIDVTRCPRCGQGRMIRQPLDTAPAARPDTS
jgi:hypothetical protein